MVWRGLHLKVLQLRPVLAVCVFLLNAGAHACGPGRHGGRRRSPRKLTPLVFKQHVPNVPEGSLAASGPFEDPVSRNDPRFRDLVLNYNEDVVFKDRKGTGEDRVMTRRLREKLDTLAISVMNYWPTVRVRVTAGYDGDGLFHAPRSLHYCARAVDLTTSDRDPAKYGMLARLAVEAGFDWVFFESRAHVHCSVKREPTITTKNAGCFHGSATVMTRSGPKQMRQLARGDEVASGCLPDGTPTYHRVVAFLHRDPDLEALFFRISLQSGHVLLVTGSHLVFLQQQSGCLDARATPAQAVRIGDRLCVVESGVVRHFEVRDVRELTLKGVYAPLTESGSIVVDNVWASCYAGVRSHGLAHAAMLPLIYGHRLWNSFWSFSALWLPDLCQVAPIHNGTFREWDTKGARTVHWYARLLTFVTGLLPLELRRDLFSLVV